MIYRDWSTPYTCGACKHFNFEGPNTTGLCDVFGKYYSPDDSCKGHYEEASDFSRYSSGGSGNSSGGSGVCCFTKAFCDYKGFADNCYELEILRKFRDTHLIKTAFGKDLVKKYYANSPRLIKAIDVRKDKNDIYEYICNKIYGIITLLENGEFKNAINTYLTFNRELYADILGEAL